MALNSCTVNGYALNAEGQTAFLPFDSQALLTISSLAANQSVVHPAAGYSTFDISAAAEGARVLRGENSVARVDTTATGVEYEQARVIRGVRGSASFDFMAAHAEPTVLISAGSHQAGFRISAIQAAAIDEVNMSFAEVVALADGTRMHRGYGRADVEVSFANFAGPSTTRYMFGDASIAILSVAEVGVNAVYEATAKAEIDFFATSDEALVRSNSLGDASIKINGSFNDSLVNVRRRFRATGTVDFDTLFAQFAITTQVDASSTFRVNTTGDVSRMRLVRANPVFGFDTRKAGPMYFASCEAIGLFGFETVDAGYEVTKGGDGQATVDIASRLAMGTRVVMATGRADIEFFSSRVQGLSNLTQPASDCYTYIVPERVFMFDVPFEERGFEVPCD